MPITSFATLRTPEQRLKLLNQLLTASSNNTSSWSIVSYPTGGSAYNSYIYDSVGNGIKNLLKFIYHFKNSDISTPIEEIYFGIHRDGTVSFIIITRVGNLEKVKTALTIENYYSRSCNEAALDHRPRITLFSTYQTDNEKSRIKSLLNTLDQLTAFDETLKNHIEDVLSNAAAMAEHHQMITTAEIDPELKIRNCLIPGLKFQPIAFDTDTLYHALKFYVNKNPCELRNMIADYLTKNKAMVVKYLDRRFYIYPYDACKNIFEHLANNGKVYETEFYRLIAQYDSSLAIDPLLDKIIDYFIEFIRRDRHADHLEAMVLSKILGQQIFLMYGSGLIQNFSQMELPQNIETINPIFIYHDSETTNWFNGLTPIDPKLIPVITKLIINTSKLREWQPKLNIAISTEKPSFSKLDQVKTIILNGTQYIEPCASVFSDKLLELIQAVIDSNVEKIKIIIDLHPQLIFQRGPLFYNAIELAENLGYIDILKLFYNAYGKITKTTIQ